MIVPRKRAASCKSPTYKFGRISLSLRRLRPRRRRLHSLKRLAQSLTGSLAAVAALSTAVKRLSKDFKGLRLADSGSKHETSMVSTETPSAHGARKTPK